MLSIEQRGVVHLFHDGRRVALHDLQGVGQPAFGADPAPCKSAAESRPGLELGDVRASSDGSGSAPRRRSRPSSSTGSVRVSQAGGRLWCGTAGHCACWRGTSGMEAGARVAMTASSRVVEVIKNRFWRRHRAHAGDLRQRAEDQRAPGIRLLLEVEQSLGHESLPDRGRAPAVPGLSASAARRSSCDPGPADPGVLAVDQPPAERVRSSSRPARAAEELAAADAETRGKEMNGILKELLPHLATYAGHAGHRGRRLQQSVRTWTGRPRSRGNMPNHHGRVVAWPVSLAMEARRVRRHVPRRDTPARSTHPGTTWSPGIHREPSGAHRLRLRPRRRVARPRLRGALRARARLAERSRRGALDAET